MTRFCNSTKYLPFDTAVLQQSTEMQTQKLKNEVKSKIEKCETELSEEETIKVLSDIISNIVFNQIEENGEKFIDNAASAICQAKPKSYMASG